MAYNGTRRDWIPSNQSEVGPAFTLVNMDRTYDDGDEMEYVNIPAGTIITMYALYLNADHTMSKTAYTYTVPEGTTVSKIPLKDFRDSRTMNYADRSIVPIGADDMVNETWTFGENPDPNSVVKRFFFVADFSGADGNLTAASAENPEQKVAVTHVMPYVADEDERITLARNAAAQADIGGIAHIQASRQFKLEGTKTVNTLNLSETPVDETSKILFSREVPLRVKTTLYDSWSENYCFEADTQNRDTMTGNSKYLDVVVYFQDELTKRIVDMPANTEVTLAYEDSSGVILNTVKTVLPTDASAASTNAVNHVAWNKDRGLVYNLGDVFASATDCMLETPMDVKIDFTNCSQSEFDLKFKANSSYAMVVAVRRSNNPDMPFTGGNLAEAMIGLNFPLRIDTGYTLTTDRWQLVKQWLSEGDCESIPMRAKVENLPQSDEVITLKYGMRFILYRWDEENEEYVQLTGHELDRFEIKSGSNLLTKTAPEGTVAQYFEGPLNGANQTIDYIDYEITPKADTEKNTHYKVVGSATVNGRSVVSDFLIFYLNDQNSVLKIR